MPTYDYDCPDCGRFAAIKRIAARDEPTDCPGCERPAPRVLVAAPQLGWTEGSTRRASARTAAEGSYPRMRHAGACDCC